ERWEDTTINENITIMFVTAGYLLISLVTFIITISVISMISPRLRGSSGLDAVEKNDIDSNNLKCEPRKYSWDEIIEICYDKQLSFIHPVIQAIYSADRTERAVVLQKPDGLYTVKFEKLYPFDEDELRYSSASCLPGYWSQQGGSNSLFDTAEHAERSIRSEPPYKYEQSDGKSSLVETHWLCPACGKEINEGLCWEYCFAENSGPTDTVDDLKKWIKDTGSFKNVEEFHDICKDCAHCQWSN
ncbi:hypothetical protein LJC34_02450, partial [Oscillospiraceae bacterium OttesenSCG-928-G22]|nr:hypothetical protein [Oscillospiraceae bacterium OttesenSCG-928-G22]